MTQSELLTELSWAKLGLGVLAERVAPTSPQAADYVGQAMTHLAAAVQQLQQEQRQEKQKGKIGK